MPRRDPRTQQTVPMSFPAAFTSWIAQSTPQGQPPAHADTQPPAAGTVVSGMSLFGRLLHRAKKEGL